MRVPKGCPLCGADVIGSKEAGFYCKFCNLMFRTRHVVFRHYREHAAQLLEKHFPKVKPVRRERERPKREPKLSAGPIDTALLDAVTVRIRENVAALEQALPTLEALEPPAEQAKKAKPGKGTKRARKTARKPAKKAVKKQAKKTAQKAPKKPPARTPKKSAKKRAAKKAAKKKALEDVVGLEALL